MSTDISTECRKIETHLSEYLDGQSPSEMAWKIQMHLSVCSHCAELVRELRVTTNLLKGVSRLELSNHFDAKLHTKLSPLVANPPKHHGILVRLISAISDSTAVRWIPRQAFALAFAGAAVAAGLVVAVNFQPVSLFLTPHIYSAPPHAKTATVGSGEIAFVAACSREHAQYQSTQPIADPAAQTLAERVDANGAAGSIEAATTSSGDD